MADMQIPELTLKPPSGEAAGQPQRVKFYAFPNQVIHNVSSCGRGVVEPVSFGNYLPKNQGGNDDAFSQWLLLVKSGKYPEYGDAGHFLAKCMNAGTLIVTVPSSTSGRVNGIHKVAEFIHDRYFKQKGLEYAEGALVRHTSVQASHLGGERSTSIHSESISLARNLTGLERPVLLLDDIFTTGSSMHACEWLLEDAGVQHITCAAIGRTRHLSPNGQLLPLESVDWYDLVED